MSFIYEIKSDKKEYCANYIEYGKQSIDESKNEDYEGDGKGQGGEQSIEEEWVIKGKINDVWDNREYCGDHKEGTVCIAIIFTDEITKDEHSDIEAGVDGWGQINENI